MKKLLCAVLSCAILMTLAACGAAAPSSGADPTPTAAPEATDAPEATPAPEATDTPEASEAEPAEDEPTGGKTLVAYFSWSGNTETLAGMIQSATGGDLFEIVPAEPYTDDYNALLDVAQAEQGENARPAIAGTVENWDEYDTVFIGYPNWWGDAPMIVLSFLEAYDCTGKTIVPFCTHGSGGFGRSVSSIQASAAGATMLDGLDVRGSSVSGAESTVSEWISGLGLGA